MRSIFYLLCASLLSFAFAVNADGRAQLVTIPTGSFEMGSTEGAPDEKPLRRVHIDSFRMHAREVTVGMYQECVDKGRCTPAHYDDNRCLQWNGKSFSRVKVPQEFRGENFPVVCVTWHQASAYCTFAGMRLPTEAQWEYAAKAGTNPRFAWGDANPSAENCNESNRRGPRTVGSCKPNAWGLYDMTGNVWEWTSDNYESNSYEHSGDTNPTGPGAGLYRAIRGGGWYSGPSELRITNRHWFSPNHAETSTGFRCVR